jgi:hypothetical protein
MKLFQSTAKKEKQKAPEKKRPVSTITESSAIDLEKGGGITLAMIPIDEELFAIEPQIEERTSWRIKARDFICSPRFQYTMSGLVVLNLALSIGEFVISLFTAKGSVNEEAVDDIENAILCTNLSLLSFFVLEVIVRAGLIGFKPYFKDGWNILDFFIVSVSCIIEALYLVNSFKELQKIVTVAMAFRLWNALRIVHLISRTLDNQEQARLDAAKDNNKKLQNELSEIQRKNDRLKKERDRQLGKTKKLEKELEIVQIKTINSFQQSWQKIVPLTSTVEIKSGLVKDKSITKK